MDIGAINIGKATKEGAMVEKKTTNKDTDKGKGGKDMEKATQAAAREDVQRKDSHRTDAKAQRQRMVPTATGQQRNGGKQEKITCQPVSIEHLLNMSACQH